MALKPLSRGATGPREYTRRLPIDNLERTRHPLEHGRCAAGQLTVGLHANRLVAVDLDSSPLRELHLFEPAMRAPVEHRQAANSQHPAHVANGHHLEEAIVGPSLGRDPHAPAEKGSIGNRNRSDSTTQHGAVVEAEPD